MRKPNILLIVMDTVRADHLSCYGYHRTTTPHIDRFTETGVIFRHAIAPSCYSVPVHASLFTGLFPSEHGVMDHHQGPGPEVQTLPGFLAEQGYQTAGFTNQYDVSSNVGYDRKFQHFVDVWRYHGFGTRKRRFRRAFSLADTGAELTNNLVRAWLTDDWRGNVPFFIFVNYNDCHAPYSPPKPFHNRYLRSPLRFYYLLRYASIYKKLGRVYADLIQFTDEDRERLVDLYDSLIAYLDFRIGQLLDFLVSKELLDDTLVILLADHGEEIGEHGIYGHQFGLYDTMVRVPMILRHPELFADGREVDAIVQHTDVLPTVRQLLSPTSTLPSQETLLTRQSPEAESTVAFAESTLPTKTLAWLRGHVADYAFDEYNTTLHMARTATRKLILSSDGGVICYDLQADPHEQHSLGNGGALPAQFEPLYRALQARTGAVRTAHPVAASDEDKGS